MLKLARLIEQFKVIFFIKKIGASVANFIICKILGSVRPFRLSFHTDLIEAPNDIDNRGFCLDYTQQPCTNG